MSSSFVGRKKTSMLYVAIALEPNTYIFNPFATVLLDNVWPILVASISNVNQ